MIRYKRVRAYFSILVAFLILGTLNHCAFEDLFATISRTLFGTEQATHLPNHLGSHSEHKHSDSTDPHRHGQPHPIIALHVAKGAPILMEILAIIASFIALAIFAFKNIRAREDSRLVRPITNGDPPSFIRKLIFSLISAPQAPPSFA